MNLTPSGRIRKTKTDIRWGRVLLAAILSEVAVVAVLLAITISYSFVIAPGQSDAEYDRFAQLAGYYVAPATGALSTFFVVLWMARRLNSGFIANGVMVGIVSVLLTLGFLATSRPEHRLMYMIAFGLRIIGGYMGGFTAQKVFRARLAGLTGASKPPSIITISRMQP